LCQLKTPERNWETFETVQTQNTDGLAFSRIQDPAKTNSREPEASGDKEKRSYLGPVLQRFLNL
jgi:hypothetical protein